MIRHMFLSGGQFRLGILIYFLTILVEKDWKKFRTGEIRHSEHFRTILVQNNR